MQHTQGGPAQITCSLPRTYELSVNESGLPHRLRAYLSATPNTRLHARGDRSILRNHNLGLFCSVKCPPTVIIQAYDTAVALRDAGVTVMGGFHSPIERDCLRFLLRGKQPIVICPARSIERFRVPVEWREPLAEGRLLLLSPFPASEGRATAALAQARNEFVLNMADAVLVAHASEGGRTAELCTRAIEQGVPVWAIDNPNNAGLLAAGARPFPTAGGLDDLWSNL